VLAHIDAVCERVVAAIAEVANPGEAKLKHRRRSRLAVMSPHPGARPISGVPEIGSQQNGSRENPTSGRADPPPPGEGERNGGKER
jgi:hypothetical protein